MTCRILLVEDDDDDAELLAWTLRRSPTTPYTLHRVDSLTACLDALSGGGFEVILLDLGLPGSAGCGALREILQAPHAPPVVVLTGLNDPDSAHEAIQAGASGYLVKSTQTEEIFAAILAAIHP